MPTISIPTKGLSGTLSRSARSFTPSGAHGLALLNVTVNWKPNQSSGPVSFFFVLDRSDAGFPAGGYEFWGQITSANNPCPGEAIACGMVRWPGIEGDDVPWVATAGPIEDEEDTEALSGYDEPSQDEETSEDGSSEDEESSEDEKPSACRVKPDNE